MARADDVVEACADALLTAAAAALPEPVYPAAAVVRAHEALMVVLQKTVREGARD